MPLDLRWFARYPASMVGEVLPRVLAPRTPFVTHSARRATGSKISRFGWVEHLPHRMRRQEDHSFKGSEL